MLRLNEKYFNSYSQLWKNNLFKKNNLTWHDVRQRRKTLKYLKIQESLGSENLTEYYLCKSIFYMFFSLPWKISYKHKVKQNKVKQTIDLAKTLWLFV